MICFVIVLVGTGIAATVTFSKTSNYFDDLEELEEK